MPDNYEPRILVLHKHVERYAVWLYEEGDWNNPRYTDHFEIIAWAHNSEERENLRNFADYHNQLIKEIANAKD